MPGERELVHRGLVGSSARHLAGEPALRVSETLRIARERRMGTQARPPYAAIVDQLLSRDGWQGSEEEGLVLSIEDNIGHRERQAKRTDVCRSRRCDLFGAVILVVTEDEESFGIRFRANEVAAASEALHEMELRPADGRAPHQGARQLAIRPQAVDQVSHGRRFPVAFHQDVARHDYFPGAWADSEKSGS